MRNILLSITLLFSLAFTGCDSESYDETDLEAFDTDGDETERGLLLNIQAPLRRIPTGAKWGPCNLAGVDQPGWWGCDGAPGVGQACARPVSDFNLNICVPQTADPAVDADCGNVTAPFGLGVSTIGGGSAYCGVDCFVDADCAGGMKCSPASKICAYVGN